MIKKILILCFILTAGWCYAQSRYVTTIHPFKEILQSVVGSRGTIHELLPPGASPHTYEMRPSDMRKVEGATALFYGASNLDNWALKFQTKQTIAFIELVPESHRFHFNGHIHIHGEESEAEHESHIDPHFWTDPLTVKALIPNLVQKLATLDPGGEQTYKKNAEKFKVRLDSLHLKINKLLAPIKIRTVILSHPFFRYYFQRYNFTVTDIIEKSPGKEPTPREVKNLIDKVNSEQVSVICTHPQLPDRAAEIVAESTAAKVVELDPLGGLENLQSYDDIILYNTRKLVKAMQ
ncbi:hypothetical protein GF337_05260 [candidate division KSB1 bacterium]|nr:hypothetical protein [candidate division KSB1 bacterium]